MKGGQQPTQLPRRAPEGTVSAHCIKCARVVAHLFWTISTGKVFECLSCMRITYQGVKL